MFTRSRERSLCWSRRMQSALPHPVFLEILFNNILSSTRRSSKWPLPSRLFNWSFVRIYRGWKECMWKLHLLPCVSSGLFSRLIWLLYKGFNGIIMPVCSCSWISRKMSLLVNTNLMEHHVQSLVVSIPVMMLWPQSNSCFYSWPADTLSSCNIVITRLFLGNMPSNSVPVSQNVITACFMFYVQKNCFPTAEL